MAHISCSQYDLLQFSREVFALNLGFTALHSLAVEDYCHCSDILFSVRTIIYLTGPNLLDPSRE